LTNNFHIVRVSYYNCSSSAVKFGSSFHEVNSAAAQGRRRIFVVGGGSGRGNGASATGAKKPSMLSTYRTLWAQRVTRQPAQRL